ncbi:hypothetical protein NHX12_002134, partial [Muraenolepis orangiensis]
MLPVVDRHYLQVLDGSCTCEMLPVGVKMLPRPQCHPGGGAPPPCSPGLTLSHHLQTGGVAEGPPRTLGWPFPWSLREVREVISQVEGQQKNLVNSIESLPARGGPLSALDE